MCVVSMITQHHFERWPQPALFPPTRYFDYQELRRKAAAYDELMKQPGCPDPLKDAWHRAVEQHMQETYGLKPKEGA